MFIASTNCSTCGNVARFNSSASTTFSAKPGTPQSFGYDTGIDTTSLPHSEGVSGVIVSDAVGIANLSIPGQQFLLCDQYPEFMRDVPIDGVMGIGPMRVSGLPSGMSWFWQLYSYKQIDKPVVSLYYPPGRATGAEATFGGTNPARYTGSFSRVYTNNSGQWEVDVSAVRFGGQPVKLPPATAILDTGTPFFTADANNTKAFYAALSPKFKPLGDRGSWGAPCDIIESLAVDMTFTLGFGDHQFNATMPKKYFNLGPYEGYDGMCQSVFSNLSHGGNSEHPVLILGAPLLSQYYTSWDGFNGKVSFATPVF